MNELQRKLKELVKKGELKEEEFEEIATKMAFEEEPAQPNEPAPAPNPENAPAVPEKPEEQPKVNEAPAEPVQPVENPEKPAEPVIPPEAAPSEKPAEAPVNPEATPEQPAEPTPDPKDQIIEDLVKKVDEAKQLIEGYDARIKAVEDIVAKLGEPVKPEEKK